MKHKKRTRNQLILEELGCPHRWNKYARRNPYSHKGKCIDCGKSRLTHAAQSIHYLDPDIAPFTLVMAVAAQKKRGSSSHVHFTWDEKPLDTT